MKRRRPYARVKLKPDAVWEQTNRRNLSQNDLARLTNISPGYLSQLISGRRSPSANVRKRLQLALDTPNFDSLFMLERCDEN